MKKIILSLLLISFLAVPMIGLATAPALAELPDVPIWDAITRVTQILFLIVIAIVVIVILYGAFMILTAVGDETKFKTGKTIIIYAILALIIALLARGGIDFIRGIIERGVIL